MSTMLICLLIFIFMVVSFSLNKIPMSVTSMICLLLLVLTGCIDATTALSNFSSSTVITMVSMFIVAAGLNRTQMINHISKLVYRVTKGSFTKVLAGYVLVTFFLGQFIPSIVALFALVCPLVIHMCEEMDISPSKMVYSIGLTAVSASFAIMPIGPYVGSMSSIITPMATAVVPMMMGAGGYSQKTLVKMGALPALLMGVIAVAIGMTIFPAYPSM